MKVFIIVFTLFFFNSSLIAQFTQELIIPSFVKVSLSHSDEYSLSDKISILQIDRSEGLIAIKSYNTEGDISYFSDPFSLEKVEISKNDYYLKYSFHSEGKVLFNCFVVIYSDENQRIIKSKKEIQDFFLNML